MTPTTLDLYMVSRLTPLTTALEVVLVLGFFAAIASLIAWVISIVEKFDQNTVSRNLRRLALTAVVPMIVAGIFRILVPTTNEAFAMIVIPRAAESQCLEDITPKVVEAAKAWLDSVAKEAK